MSQESKATLIEQLKLLEDWNNRHIGDNPEQVRRNIETMLTIENYLSSDKLIFPASSDNRLSIELSQLKQTSLTSDELRKNLSNELKALSMDFSHWVGLKYQAPLEC